MRYKESSKLQLDMLLQINLNGYKKQIYYLLIRIMHQSLYKIVENFEKTDNFVQIVPPQPTNMKGSTKTTYCIGSTDLLPRNTSHKNFYRSLFIAQYSQKCKMTFRKAKWPSGRPLVPLSLTSVSRTWTTLSTV